MFKNYFLFLSFFLVVGVSELSSQEIRIFKVSDFDLKGNVKSCLVSTDYGKEEYEFNEAGLLTKSVTRYSDTDYEITYYKYSGKELLEKRFESYRDNTFDNSTSIANFYVIDTTEGKKITEKIVSYDKEFLDLYEHYFDANDQLYKLVHSNNNGTDETLVKQNKDSLQATTITTYESNEEVLKIINEKILPVNDSVSRNKTITKKFLNGEANTAVEEEFNEAGKLLERIKLIYNSENKKFVPQETVQNEYDELGMLSKSKTISGKRIETKEYIYQFDRQGNWIKEIITPDNAYKTRKIRYFESAKEEEKSE